MHFEIFIIIKNRNMFIKLFFSEGSVSDKSRGDCCIFRDHQYVHAFRGCFTKKTRTIRQHVLTSFCTSLDIFWRMFFRLRRARAQFAASAADILAAISYGPGPRNCSELLRRQRKGSTVSLDVEFECIILVQDINMCRYQRTSMQFPW